ncbi:MAG: hydrolase [archaeon GBS-70-058]|nr:hydrolase [Candidatus Culexarchaeum nevadense]
MPFTLLHLGPGLGLGLPLRKRIHAPTFILASIIIDVEPFLVISLKLEYPLHGYLHTFLAALIVGLVLGCIMYLLEGSLKTLYRKLLLEGRDNLDLRQFIIAGILGAELHILLDSLLYEDIKPLYPLTINPLYNPKLKPEIYTLCIWMGMLGLAYYIWLIGLAIYEKLPHKP